MDPKVLHFLYLNGLVVLVLILYLVRRPKKRIPRLKLRNFLSKGDAMVAHTVDFANAPEQTVRRERRLNVIFQFNGHDFDAYEILGLPAGSQWQAVEVAYEKMVKSADPGDDEIYHHAFNAIRRSVSGG